MICTVKWYRKEDANDNRLNLLRLARQQLTNFQHLLKYRQAGASSV
ncbi:hypothetical protein [Nitrospira sp. Ecomares 2.1]